MEITKECEIDMFKAVLFDLDGVLVDSEPAYKRVDMRILESLGICMPNEEYDTWMGTAGEEMFAQLKKQYGFSQSVGELYAIGFYAGGLSKRRFWCH